MTKWFPVFLTILLGGWIGASPDIQRWMAQHLNLAIGMIAVFVLMMALVPSPFQSEK